MKRASRNVPETEWTLPGQFEQFGIRLRFHQLSLRKQPFPEAKDRAPVSACTATTSTYT